MDERIYAVQYGQRVLVAIHKPLLDVPFPNRKQPSYYWRKLFNLEHLNPVVLANFPYSCCGEKALRCYGRHAVKGVIYDPVKHFN